ncbi:PAS domain S-box protein [Singulisphaera sp. PoT]|uniref:PAS domain S-box protein n=1 Tax=Singulisphaera sp. PoT TaxID=3411797 RepID=UPI003BF4BBE5
MIVDPKDELARLAALGRYAILDTGPEQAFDDLVRLAAFICGAPIALISLVDADRQWFKARYGLGVVETPRDVSFCSHAILGEGTFVVPDAALDDRFARNPLVTGDPGIRFYAGSPLVDPAGHPLGTLCVLDRVPRELGPAQLEMLRALGRQAMAQLEARQAWFAARRSEGEARESQARKAALFEASDDAIATVDVGGKILEFNPAAERMFGYTGLEARGLGLDELVLCPDGVTARLAGPDGPRARDRVEAVARRKDGGTVLAEMSWIAVRHDGRPEFIVRARDIEDRRRIEEEHRALAAIVESSDDAIISKDLDGIISSWNAGAERLFGYSREEAVGRHISFLIPDERAGEMDAVLARVRRGERVEHFETRRRAKDGRIIDVSLSVSPIRDARGRIVGSSKVARDITDRVRSERALRESEAQARRLALVASRTDNAVIITDAHGRIEWVNEGFTRVTEYSPEEAIGRRPGSFLQGPGTDPEAVRHMRERQAAGLGFTAEVLNYSKSGREYWLAIDARPIRDEAGMLRNFIAIESDVTQKKRAEAELRRAHDELELRVRERTAELLAQADSLRRAEEAYRSIFENAIDGIYQVGPDGRFLRANPALARILGYASPEELMADLGVLGRQLYVDPARRGEFLAIVDERGLVAGFESQVRRKDGAVIWISESSRAARDAAGHVLYYEGFVVDVTERRESEAKIRSLNRELAAAYDETIEGWAKALDLRDKETEGHTRRVTEMSLRLARAMGLAGEDLVHIRRGALLHDIGKLGVPDAVLLKPGKLTEPEWEVMRRHPTNARDWLEGIPVLRRALEIPYGHHERWDGTGYPEGVAGEAIPLSARLFAAVDIWDALRSDRPYRAAWPEEEVRGHLRSLSGTHLDPAVVSAFIRLLEGKPGPAAAAANGRATSPTPAGPAARRPRIRVGDPRPGGSPARVRELERENARLAELANTDDLTGLRNRRHFRRACRAAIEGALARDAGLTLVVLDLDGFKAYNDRHGHPAGDEALRDVAVLLRSRTGPGTWSRGTAARSSPPSWPTPTSAREGTGRSRCARR